MNRLIRQISDSTALNLWGSYVLRFTFYVLCCFYLFGTWTLDVRANTNARTDQTGITVEFDLPKLEVSTVKRNGIRYQAVSFEGSGFTSEAGNPRLPVSRVTLGVPPNVKFQVEILHTTTETRSGYRIPPVPHNVPKSSSENPSSFSHPENFQTLEEEWREDGPAYRSSSNYPKTAAQVVYDGYIRSQRILYLELRPVQYQPKSRVLRIHPRMTVRIHFVHQGSDNRFQSASTSSSQFMTIEPASFERMYQNLLLNYDEAKRWRVPTVETGAAPGALNPDHSTGAGPAAQEQTNGERYKILVDKTGIYRLTSEDLRQKWGLI